MNIFIHAHYYLPKTLAGAEKYLHEIAKYLAAKGHLVIVSNDEDGDYDFEGIKVVSNNAAIIQYYIWADAIITHLNHAGTAMELGRRFNKPVFHLLHNNDPYYELFESPANNFIIYNSEALRKELMLNLPSIVAHPAFDYEYWISGKDHYFNEYITLVNCCIEKGGLFLQFLADAMPGYRFMGVKGSYNSQIIQNSHHRNIQFVPPQMDMRNVYDQTRIIIIPSKYESWGMVASEAMASGIPVICTPTAGLKENCGDAAIYAEARVQPYREAIESLLDKSYYDKLVSRGKKRNKTNDLNKILTFMEQNIHGMPGIIPDPKKKQEPGEEELPYPSQNPVENPPKEEENEDDPAIYEPEEDEDDIKEKKIVEKPQTKQRILKPGRPRKLKAM